MHGLNVAASMYIPTLSIWKGYKDFIDLGGSRAHLACRLAKMQTHLKGQVLDLEECKEPAETYIKSLGLEDKVTFSTYNFFKEEAFPPVDCYIISHVFLNWSEPDKDMLVRKTFAALRPGGSIIINDDFMDDD